MAGKTSPADRHNRVIYDQQDRQCIQIDPLGFVTELLHDGKGKVTGKLRYYRQVSDPVGLASAGLDEARRTLDGQKDTRDRRSYT